MKTLILSDGIDNGAPVAKLADSLEKHLIQIGHEVTHIRLRDQQVSCCTGCFTCWLTTPGECIQNDDGNMIARLFINSQRVIVVSAVVFGSISSRMKYAMERFIPIISPLFQKWRGEWHHKERYSEFPDVAYIGWANRFTDDSKKVFTNLVERNFINFRSEKGTVWFVEGDNQSDWSAFVSQWDHSRIPTEKASKPSRIDFEKPTASPDLSDSKSNRFLLLTGSPRGKRSSSARILEYISGSLPVDTETRLIHLYSKPNQAASIDSVIDDIRWADTVVLAFPLYVDGLPAVMLEQLEKIYAETQNTVNEHALVADKAFAVICNCGFPESHQCHVAVDMCGLFARDVGMKWMGGLSIGMGGMLGGKPLTPKGPLKGWCHGLSLAAQDLFQGKAISDEAIQSTSKPPFGYWLYAFMAGFSMRRSFKPKEKGQKINFCPYK